MIIESTLTVLIADDFSSMRKAVGKIIKSLKYEVIGEAVNGQEAVSIYKSKRPDLVLLDFDMPVKTGGEALRDIIKIDPQAIVIMLTSRTEPEIIKAFHQDGASGYIPKDMPPEDIRTTIKKIWDSINTAL